MLLQPQPQGQAHQAVTDAVGVGHVARHAADYFAPWGRMQRDVMKNAQPVPRGPNRKKLPVWNCKNLPRVSIFASFLELYGKLWYELGIPVDRDRSFRFIVTGHSGLS